MKKSKCILESEGIVTGNSQWIKLCDAIIMYMWDLDKGLANKLNNEDEITKQDIEDYLEKNTKVQNVIPEWIGDFVIYIKDSSYPNNGSFLKSQATLEDNKLVFQINLKDRKDQNLMHDTLIHEFRHAYSRYIQLMKNINVNTKKDIKNNKLYGMAKKGFLESDQKLDIVKSSTLDSVEVNENLLKDPNNLAKIILQSFYYLNSGEIQSFLQEFHISIQKIILSKKDTLIKEISEIRKFKGNFNTTIDEQQMQRSVLNSISVTPYLSSYFLQYKAFQILMMKLKSVDLDVAHETFKLIGREIKTYLDIPIAKALTHNDYETEQVLKKISEKESKLFDFVILKMNRIFAREIIKFEEENM